MEYIGNGLTMFKFENGSVASSREELVEMIKQYDKYIENSSMKDQKTCYVETCPQSEISDLYNCIQEIELCYDNERRDNTYDLVDHVREQCSEYYVKNYIMIKKD